MPWPGREGRRSGRRPRLDAGHGSDEPEARGAQLGRGRVLQGLERPRQAQDAGAEERPDEGPNLADRVVRADFQAEELTVHGLQFAVCGLRFAVWGTELRSLQW